MTFLGGLYLSQSLGFIGLGSYLILPQARLFSLNPAARHVPMLELFGVTIAGALTALIGILGLPLTIALLKLKRWAWLPAMSLQGLALLLGIIEYLQRRPYYIGMLLGAVIVLLLNQREVHHALNLEDIHGHAEKHGGDME